MKPNHLRFDGLAYEPRDFYPLPYSDDITDPWQRQPVTVGEQQIHISKRLGGIGTWSSYGIDWMRIGDGGTSMMLNDRWQHNLNMGVENGEVHHNPTKTACTRSPRGGTLQQIIASPCEFLDVAQEGANSLRVRSCSIPFDYDAEGYELPAKNDRGGDFENRILWFLNRHWEDASINWRGIEGVHHINNWSYHPWRLGEGAGRWRGWWMSGIGIVDLFGAANPICYDPETKIKSECPFWKDHPRVSYRYFPAEDPRIVCNVQHLRPTTVDTEPPQFIESPWSTGYIALIGHTEGFAMGYYAYLHPDDEGQRQLNCLHWLNKRQWPWDVSPHSLSGHVFALMNRSNHARVSGWLGHHSFWVQGRSLAEVIDKINLLHGSKALDKRAPFTVPDAVLDRMHPLPNVRP